VRYADILDTHRTLFADVYPWAGQDRLQNAGDLLISRGGHKNLFAHPMHLRHAAGWGLDRGSDPAFMRLRPGTVMGALAHAHPFLDGNGRTIMTVHEEMARRAGISVQWERTNKSDYLAALTAELKEPASDGKSENHLDHYLASFIGPARELVEATTRLETLPGLGPESDGPSNAERRAAFMREAQATVQSAPEPTPPGPKGRGIAD
jgi:cell filamentation protein